MPWQEHTRMELRQEFVVYARTDGVSMREACRRYAISPKTGYKWLARAAAGETELADRSRRPQHSPGQTGAALEAAVLACRAAHPAWGGRKIHHWLAQQRLTPVPAPSTITDILRRHGCLVADPASPRRWERFEHAAPNEVWQMDFMGHLALDRGRVHPLTVLDDHSRFALVLAACADERAATVQAALTACFRRYGLPRAILTDNGPPWSTSGKGGITALEAWLLRLGIAVWHGRPYHPQTQGKVERLHGTVAAEVVRGRPLTTLTATQAAFDAFRFCYNHERPHEALAYATPASRYTPSRRRFPRRLPELRYGPDDAVRKVRDQGAISFGNRSWFISRGLVGEHVAVRPTAVDGQFIVIYAFQQVAELDLRTAGPV